LQFFWKVNDANEEYDRVTPVFVKQASGSSLINLATVVIVDPFQKPEITFPYKKTVSVPENKFKSKYFAKLTSKIHNFILTFYDN
jgi:archaellin